MKLKPGKIEEDAINDSWGVNKSNSSGRKYSSLDLRKRIALAESSHFSPACRLGRRRMKIRINIEYLLNVCDRGDRAAPRKACPNVTFSTTNLTYNGGEPNRGFRGKKSNSA